MKLLVAYLEILNIPPRLKSSYLYLLTCLYLLRNVICIHNKGILSTINCKLPIQIVDCTSEFQSYKYFFNVGCTKCASALKYQMYIYFHPFYYSALQWHLITSKSVRWRYSLSEKKLINQKQNRYFEKNYKSTTLIELILRNLADLKVTGHHCRIINKLLIMITNL